MDEPLLEVSTDKVHTEIPSPACGAPLPNYDALSGVPVVLTKDPTNMHLSCGDMGAAVG